MKNFEKENEIPLHEIKILLIDDSNENLELHENQLKRYGYEKIEKAASAAEALEMFSNKRHFDVIVADMWMEESESGFKIVKEGEEKLSSTIIILTVNDNVLDCRKAFKIGAWDYIPKNKVDINPFEELHKSILEAIKFNNEWGNSRDESWISDHIDELTEKFPGQYVAIMDREPIAQGKTKDDLFKEMEKTGQPTFMPIIIKIPDGEFL
ncbi:MAG: response regulator [Desulfobacterales bacterium]|nr:response regulator [Desulfobacterales bacterium]